MERSTQSSSAIRNTLADYPIVLAGNADIDRMLRNVCL